MSFHSDLFEDFAAPALFEGLAEEIGYTRLNGDASTPWAIIGSEGTRIDEKDQEGREEIRERVVKLHTDPTSDWGGVADPAIDEKVTIAGEDWSVYEVESLGGLAVLKVRRAASVRTAGKGYGYPG